MSYWHQARDLEILPPGTMAEPASVVRNQSSPIESSHPSGPIAGPVFPAQDQAEKLNGCNHQVAASTLEATESVPSLGAAA